MDLFHSPVSYLSAFLGGILISFTPCVYPLIPITIGYIGVRAAGSKLKGFILSLFYVSGVAITYSLLGVLASLTGTIFGAITSHPITYFLVGAVIILFGLSMLDLFVIPLPNIIKLPALKKQNYFSTFLLGLSSGLAVSPCLTPVLGSILFYLITKKNVLYGATLLLSFAYGMGLVLVLIGTFSSLLVNLPKSDKWMLYIKRVLAFILIGMGIYFIFSGISRTQPKKPQFELKVKELELSSDFTLQDLNQNTFTLSSYKDKQPVILFFWATWCPHCLRELRLLNDIYQELIKDGWELLTIDVDEPASLVNNFVKKYALNFKVLLDKEATVASAYGILGIPTYILVDKQGYIVFKDHYFPQGQYKELSSK